MTTPDIQQITELVRQASDPIALTEHIYLIAGDDGSQRLVDIREYEANPRLAKTANRSVRDTRSFLSYLGKHVLRETEVYADLQNSRIVAIIDAHQGADAPSGRNQHRLALDLVHTPEWKTWVEMDGKPMKQADFAEFIEANHVDVVGNDGVTLLEVAQDLQGATSVEWQAGQRLANGEVKLTYKETVQARVGNRDDVTIPSKFEIAVKPYLGSARYRVGVSFRYRIKGNEVTMSYHLDRPHVTLESAFDDMVRELQAGLPATDIDLEPGQVDGAKLTLPALEGVAEVLFGVPEASSTRPF
jgi:uncharacterized protein YfdQ (DUF2303 family)